MKIGIIGAAGKMGRWFARFLHKEGFELLLADIDKSGLNSISQELGVKTASDIMLMRESDIILLAVSIDGFEEAIKQISSQVRPGQIIVDITSVKEFTVRIMHEKLRGAVVLGTHPLFGPGARDLANQNFVLTPTNESENKLAEQTADFLQKHGVRVTIMSPQKHDEVMSVVLGLSHFISIVAADTLIDLGKTEEFKAVGGSTYRVLTTLVESVVSEDPRLYAALQMHLPYIREAERLFQKNTEKWADMVKNHDKQGFINQMEALKSKFAQENANFGQAYENMYKIMEWL